MNYILKFAFLQTVFNEALKKVVAEKDKVIEELKGREAALILQHEDDTGKVLNTYSYLEIC